MANYTSTHTGANIDSAITDVLALVGAGLSKNLVLGSGNGIDYSATADAGEMTSELLDDYEEGTWAASEPFYTSAGSRFYSA